MTRDDIIKLAREADEYADKHAPSWTTEIDEREILRDQRFAHLIEEHLRFDSIHSCGNDCQRPACVQGREQRARVYEECAKICEEKIDAEYATGKVDHNEMAWTQACAIAIRARGKA